MESSLVDFNIWSPHWNPRTEKVSRITPHCTAGEVTAQSLGNWFARPTTKASSNYGIGKDNKIACFVPEEKRSWASSSRDNDHKAITIECSSKNIAPFEVDQKVFDTLIMLTTDICLRYNTRVLKWIPEKNLALSYKLSEDEMLITLHRWFTATECPGQWLFDHMAEYATKVTEAIQKEQKIYCVQVGVFRYKQNAIALCQMLRDEGHPAFIVEK